MLKLSKLSDLTVEPYDDNDGLPHLRFYNPTTGFELIANGSHLMDDDGIAPHLAVIRNRGTFKYNPTPLLDLFTGLMPDPMTTIFTPVPNGDRTDTVKDQHQTGPSNRRLYPPFLRHVMLHSDPTKQQAAYDYAYRFAQDQLFRPMFHGPPYRFDESEEINKGQLWAWSFGKKTPAGWNFIAVDHNDCAILAGLAAMNDDLGLTLLAVRWWATVNAMHSPATHWMSNNQPRCELWTLALGVFAELSGLGSCDAEVTTLFADGWRPKKAVQAWVEQGIAAGVDPLIGGPTKGPDPRVMSVLLSTNDFEGFGKQSHGDYGFQRGMRLSGWMLALRSGLLDLKPQLKIDALAHAEKDAADFLAKCYGSTGLSWAYGRTVFPDLGVAERLKAALDVQDLDPIIGINKNRRPYEAHPLATGGAILREVPITQDIDLALPGLIGLRLLGATLIDEAMIDALMSKKVVMAPGNKNFAPAWGEPSIALYAALKA